MNEIRVVAALASILLLTFFHCAAADSGTHKGAKNPILTPEDVEEILSRAEQATKLLERWECRDIASRSGPILVVATVLGVSTAESKLGALSVAGVTYKAWFQVSGFDRRWDFGSEYKYSFIIRPNGDGAYYDFSREKTAKPSQLMSCSQR